MDTISNEIIRITVRKVSDNTSVVTIQGEIDLYTSPKIKESLYGLINKGKHHLIINLQGVRHLDSAGLGILVGRLRDVREVGGSLYIVCTKPLILKIFQITGLDKAFSICESDEDALQAISKQVQVKAK